MQLKHFGKMPNLPLMQTLVWFIGLLVFVTAAPAQPDDDVKSRYYYTGTIGKKIAIQMDIQIQGQKVSGWYYYDTIGVPFSLSGTLNEIEERDSKNRKTGSFRGTLTPLGKTFDGRWLSPNGKKRLPFKLTKVAEYIFSNTRQGESLEVSAVYPHFLSQSPAWQKINSALEKSIREEHTNFMVEGQAAHAEELIS